MAAKVRRIGYLQLVAKNGRRYEYGMIVEGQYLKTDVSFPACEVRHDRRIIALPDLGHHPTRVLPLSSKPAAILRHYRLKETCNERYNGLV